MSGMPGTVFTSRLCQGGEYVALAATVLSLALESDTCKVSCRDYDEMLSLSGSRV